MDEQLDLTRTANAAVAGARKPLRVVGLFAGIGGVELGLSRSGHESALFSELDPFAREVLANRFPGIECIPDVRDVRTLPECDLLAAGLPESPALGQALEQTLARKLDGEVDGREDELRLALEIAGEGT